MNCGAPIGKSDYCTSCGFHVEVQKKIWQLSNTYYNLGLDKAQIRDLSGAIDPVSYTHLVTRDIRPSHR